LGACSVWQETSTGTTRCVTSCTWVKIRRTAVVFPVPGGPRSTVFNGEKPWTAGRRAKARSFIWASR